MKIQEIRKQKGKKVFIFRSIRKDGYILDSIKIHINSKSRILQMDIEELKLGSCSFGIRGRLISCQSWETEEEGMRRSDLSKHFTVLTSRESRGINFAKIICRRLQTCIKKCGDR